MVESLFVQFLELLLPILKNGETLSAEEISFLQYSKSKVGLIQVNFDAVTIDYSEIRAFLLKTRSEAVKSLLGRCMIHFIGRNNLKMIHIHMDGIKEIMEYLSLHCTIPVAFTEPTIDESLLSVPVSEIDSSSLNQNQSKDSYTNEYISDE
jgi:hypothetical protein